MMEGALNRQLIGERLDEVIYRELVNIGEWEDL